MDHLSQQHWPLTENVEGHILCFFSKNTRRRVCRPPSEQMKDGCDRVNAELSVSALLSHTLSLPPPSLFLSLSFYSYIHIYSHFCNKIVSRCFTEAETRRLNPLVTTVAKNNLLLKERNPEKSPACKEAPSC